jgi:2'-5' RNA ligase
LRWAPREQWHVTLTFLGEVPDGAVPDLEHRLGRVAGRHAPFPVELGGGGRFGHWVLFASVRSADHRLHRLAEATDAAARRIGIDVETRSLRPHLTLARARDEVDLRPLVTELEPLHGVGWVVDDVRLVRSRLGQGPGHGAIHETVLALPLTGNPQRPSRAGRAEPATVIEPAAPSAPDSTTSGGDHEPGH